MYIVRTYECDNGGEGESHQFEMMIKSDEHPKFCPTCGNPFDNLDDIKVIPGTKNVGKSNINKAVDLTYRALEESSAARAELAGNPNFKITDMKDNLRQGDVAAMPIHNSVTQFMDEAGSQGAKFGWGGGASVATSAPIAQVNPDFKQKAGAVKGDGVLNGMTGPGHVALSAIQGDRGQTHIGKRAEQVHAGRLNKGT